MDSFSDRLLRKREALLSSNDRLSRKNGVHKEVPRKSESNGLVSVVHYWLRFLLRRGFTFQQILKESGVSRAFLEQTYQELSLNIPEERAPNDDEQKRRDKCTGSLENNNGKPKNIEADIRQFMFRTILEVNKITASLRNPEIAEQLKDEKTRQVISKYGQHINRSLQGLFQKIEDASKSSPTQLQRVKRERADKLPEYLDRKIDNEKNQAKDKIEVSPPRAFATSKSSQKVCIQHPIQSMRTTNNLAARTGLRPVQTTKQPPAKLFTPYQSLIPNNSKR